MLNFFELIISQIKNNNTKVIYNFDKYVVYIDSYNNKYIESKDNSFHLLFNKKTGQTFKWGKTYEEDVDYCPFGNEIADIEITKACRGIRNKDGVRIPCPWCYKSNNAQGSYMNFETFKTIFDKLNAPMTMTQIAFGLDAEASIEMNPDIWEIFDYCNYNNVTPNVTVADINENTAQKLIEKCGAIAVSYYELIDKNRCYDSVKLLTDTAKKLKKEISINIHCLLSQETYDGVFELIYDRQHDNRLSDMNAIVFLSLKQKGRGTHFNKLSDEQFKTIVDECFNHNIPFGMDSCSCPKFLKAIKDRSNRKELETFCESCESTLFSLYIDVNGNFYPCSFMEKEGEWEHGISMTKINDFVKDVWYEDRVVKWREESVKCLECNGCNMCKFYDV